jgi:phosphatidylethanolamine/phosphatidyl-N-methylethanolamine N-methyltransferase
LIRTKNNSKEAWIFLKRWFKHPLRLGAIAPSSQALADLICRQVAFKEDGIVVELGAGTGSLTRRLISAGIPLDRLFVVELDPELHSFLAASLPQANVILGDARHLEKLLPAKYIGKVSTIVSGMPVSTMPFKIQKEIIDSAFKVLSPEGDILQYSYRHTSPLPSKRLGLESEKRGITFKNIPPATVWRYCKKLAAKAA